MMSFRTMLIVIGCVLLFSFSSRAQQFFAPGVSAFTPEIDVVNTGIVSDISATVSPDRKYVTLGVRAHQSTLIELNNFAFQRGAGPRGFVGGVQFQGAGLAAGAFGEINPPVTFKDGQGAAILQQRGMTRIVLK